MAFRRVRLGCLWAAAWTMAVVNNAACSSENTPSGNTPSEVTPSANTHPGAAIYAAKCVDCHGGAGQGDPDGYDEPLYGDHSVDVLARIIERTMPEDDPEQCVGDDARQVADYIHREFYSPAARQRKGLLPAARVELARLTVSQHRNAIADLIGQFTPEPQPQRRRGRRRRDDDTPQQESISVDGKVGLLGEYYQSKGMSKADQQKLQRVDSQVDFDFGEGSPVDDITADQFAIIWQGTLFVTETGHHEFRVTTPNGARLYVNNDPAEDRRKLRDDSAVAGQAALIDGWVSSGQMREHTARVFLLGGRGYPVRLEFFKYKEKNASIKFEWKPPQGTWSIVDHRFLRPQITPRIYVLETPFPADDRSLGYERGSSVAREWHTAATNAAIAAADEIVERLPLLSNVDEQTEDGEQLLKDFIAQFASVAFRRPLTGAETELLQTVPFADAPNLDAAVRRALLLVLNSPHFLYTDLTPPGQTPTQHMVAARLAWALWDSIPDQELRDAASHGELASTAQVEQQARRLMADPRAKDKMRGFFRHWLEIEERDLSKDKEKFPQFDETIIGDLRYSLESFIEDVVWSPQSDYRQLLMADYLVLNDRLRQLYLPPDDSEQTVTEDAAEGAASVDGSDNEQPSGDPSIADTNAADSSQTSLAPQLSNADFIPVKFPPNRRAGVLTHPYLLSAFAYHNNTSPIHRGVFITRNIVGRELKPPPIAVAFKDDEFDPQLTMREKITQLTRDAACMSCHSVINPLGFTLENFDAVGRWRTSDNNKPVDTESQYTTDEGETVQIRSARDVASFAVTSKSAHRAFVTQLYHHLVRQNPAAYGAGTLQRLRNEFAADDFNIQNMVSRIAVLTARYGTTETPEARPES